MSVKVVVGAQWGDEGKGKIVDLLSENAELVVRYQGGANAGHTVIIKDKKYVLHMIPSGVLHQNTISAIGNGVVFDYNSFLDELEMLEKGGVNLDNRLFVSPYAHVVMPYHPQYDRARENAREHKIGTTFKGIGPTYEDKTARTGLRIAEILDEEYFPIALKKMIDAKNNEYKLLFGEGNKFIFDDIYADCKAKFDRIKPFVKDVSLMIDEVYKKGGNIIFEGAQGTLLDVDCGTYPFVTSSNTVSGGACSGSGMGPTKIDEVIGIFKAYTTRVGNGPFVTELFDEEGEKLRQLGGEFGATTGRPRRCGHLDLLLAKYAVRMNGLTSFVLTKIDVLSSYSVLKVCTAYKYQDKILNDFVPLPHVMEKCEPIYTEMPGWECDITKCKTYDELPLNARKYIEFIESFSEIKVSIVSVGPERNQSIFRT